MKRFNPARVLLIIVAAVLFCAASPSAARAADKKPLTPGDIWRLKAVGEPQLSSDGKWIAYTLSATDFDKNSRNSDIWLVAAEGGEPRRMTTSEKRDDTPSWSPDGTALAFISARGDDVLRVPAARRSLEDDPFHGRGALDPEAAEPKILVCRGARVVRPLAQRREERATMK